MVIPLHVKLNQDRLKMKFTILSILFISALILSCKKSEQNQITEKYQFANEEHLSNIFEPFKQADTSTTRKYGGTGLGLAICKNLTEAMGGRLWAQSFEGKGTTFYFNIEALPGEPEELSWPRKKDPDISGAEVLLLESSKTHSTLIADYLNKWGLSTTIAHTLKDAVQALKEKKRDIIFFDEKVSKL